MGLTINGKSIPGTPEAPIPAPPDLQVKTTKYFGIIGESELNGKRGGRDITVRIVIHNSFGSYDALRVELRNIGKMVGEFGELRVSSIRAQFLDIYADCRFRGFTPDGESEGRSGPLKDEAGTLRTEAGNADGGWWIRGTLHFRQLTV